MRSRKRGTGTFLDLRVDSNGQKSVFDSGEVGNGAVPLRRDGKVHRARGDLGWSSHGLASWAAEQIMRKDPPFRHQVPSGACRDAVNTACVKQRGHGQVEVCRSHLGWYGIE